MILHCDDRVFVDAALLIYVPFRRAIPELQTFDRYLTVNYPFTHRS
jgi:hypothetical protein